MAERKTIIGLNKEFTKTKKVLEDYGKVKKIYYQYIEFQRQLGKSRRDIMSIEEIEKNLESMWIKK